MHESREECHSGLTGFGTRATNQNPAAGHGWRLVTMPGNLARCEGGHPAIAKQQGQVERDDRERDMARLGHGLGLSQATAYRYLAEAIEVLAARAPDLREALERVRKEGLPYLILDGNVVAAERKSARKARRSTGGIPARRTASAGTSKPYSPLAAVRCGPRRSCPVTFMTSPLRAGMPWVPCGSF